MASQSDRGWFTAKRTRWLLGGPMAVLIAIMAMGAMPLWFPTGAAGVDHLVFPLILFPALWAAGFFYAILAENLRRAALVMTALALINAACIAVLWTIS
ncbi:MAG: hypothetical protein KJ904_07005 [Alphaproteobacteria bacterium]|nr:hypothetical protein [Alphaproteobacteria bacterium]MBU0797335.1 hypothetical protein [Alphaproteobacteria bacterium]MBU0886897.1 hypothetical protein [Alphaproteobacteria bacterium]MBU1812360.1 hypothetical protein [Alphaproteobacteria bacterium]MBU2090490.1 hypothetical protein [Alphaproteobacteria bacterium]